jgi:opacity protein-like surface antigen
LYGQGFHAKFGTAVAYPINETTVLGGGLNFILKTAYKPVEGIDKFRPGNETSLFAGIDVKFAERSKWNADIAYSFYGQDQVQSGGEWIPVYGSGNRFLFNTSMIYGFEGGTVTGSLLWRQKGRNDLWDGTTWTKRKNGNQFEFEVVSQFESSKTFQYRFAAEGRIYGDNEDRTGSAGIYGLGAGVSYAASPTVSLDTDLRYLFGKGKFYTTIDVDVSGLDWMGGITYRF